MSPHQIIFLTPGFPSDEADTSCIPALQDFVLGWKEFYPEILLRVISFQYPYQQKNYYWNGIEVYAAGGRNGKGIFKYATWRRVKKQLAKWSDSNTILLSYFLTEASYIAHRFGQRKGIPHYAIAAGQDVRKQNHYLRILPLKKMKVICFNQKMSDELFRSSGKQVDFIIPIGIPERIHKISTGVSRTTDVLMVGSLIPLKRFDVALKILKEVKKEFPSLKAEIIGEGIERKKLEVLCKELGLEINISFTGALSREQVLKKMQQSKILLHTSSYEGQSTVISEALATGMAVVCFDIGRLADHPKIFVCNTSAEMVEHIRSFLINIHLQDFSPVIPITMQATIAQYSSMIGLERKVLS